MISPITLDALRVLDAIDRKHSFAAAADALFRVPSAVSYTVSKLEEDLGVALFDRSRRRAVLTPVGRLVLDQGRHILDAVDALTRVVQSVADGWEAELRIGVDNVLDPEPLYHLIGAFNRLRPQTEIRVVEEVLGGTWDALTSGRCDLVVGAAGEGPPGHIATLPLGAVEFVFAVAADHPLCEAERPLAAAAIRPWPTVVVADSSRYLPARSSGLLDGRSRIVVPTFAHKVEAQRQGVGVGFLPRHRIVDELAAGRLRELPLAEPRLPQPISVAWQAANKGKALAWFIAELGRLRFDAGVGLVANGTSANPL